MGLSLVWPPCSNQGLLVHVTQGSVQSYVWLPPGMDFLQFLWVWSPLQWHRISCLSVFAHLLLSCHWRPLRKVLLCLLHFLHQAFITHWHDSPKPSPLQAKQSQLPQPLSIWQTPQPTDPLCEPLIDSYQHAHVSLAPRSPDLDTIPDVSRRGEGSPPSDSACWLQSAQSSETKGTKSLQGWGLHTIPGEPVSVFDHPHIKQNFSASLLRRSCVLTLKQSNKETSLCKNQRMYLNGISFLHCK